MSDNEILLCSQSSNLVESESAVEGLIPQEAVEHAVLEADRTEGASYDHLALDTDLLETTSESTDPSYLEKVYKIVEWHNVATQITPRVYEIYQMRYRNKCVGADSVYDAWLLLKGLQRGWFPHWENVPAEPMKEKYSSGSSEEEGSDEDTKVVLSVAMKKLSKQMRTLQNRRTIRTSQSFLPFQLWDTTTIISSDEECVIIKRISN